MPRQSSAALTQPAPEPAHELTRDPANDVATRDDARDAPRLYVLTDAQRRHYTALALALPAVARKAPAHIDQRLAWVDRIQARAWRDRARLATFAILGEPVTAEEIDDLGARIEFAREVFAAHEPAPDWSTAPANADPTTMTDAQLAEEIRRHQLTLCDPLGRRLRHAREPLVTLRGKRAVVREVVRARGVNSLQSNSVNLLGLCDDPSLARWLGTLPKGEATALARLRALHPEWVRRTKTGASASRVADLPQRAWALVMEPLPRILESGRYLVKGDAAREGDYRGFTPRVARKRATKDAAPETKPAPTPQPT